MLPLGDAANAEGEGSLARRNLGTNRWAFDGAEKDTFTLKDRRGNLASEMRDASISAQRNANPA
jgi:predicted lipoprotein with Yx(FWY)xxD motif